MTFPEMIHGAKPEVASFIPTDPLEELSKLMTGEIKDWSQITDLSDLYQTYMMGAFEKAIPGFTDIMKAGGEDTSAMLEAGKSLMEGIFPEGVKEDVFRSSAFQGLMSGGGPAFTQSLQARDLGLTGLNMLNQGAQLASEGTNAAQRWQQIASGTMLPPSSQLYSPEWFSNFIAQQNAAKQATKQLKYNVAAAPDPVVSGIAGTVMNLVGAYLGHGMGGGGNMLATSDPMKMYGEGTSTSQALGPSFEQAWAGTDAYGNPIATGGAVAGAGGAVGNTGAIPTGAGTPSNLSLGAPYSTASTSGLWGQSPYLTGPYQYNPFNFGGFGG